MTLSILSEQHDRRVPGLTPWNTGRRLQPPIATQRGVLRMKKYKHWLKIDGYWNDNKTQKAYQNLINYLSKYPCSKITVFIPKYSLFHRYFCLECPQNYNDLDLDCNSFFDGSLIHLNCKPSNIDQSKRCFEEFIAQSEQA